MISRNHRKLSYIVFGVLLCSISFLYGCKAKPKKLSVLPLENHPVTSFDPLISLSEVYESSKEWDIPYDKLDNHGVISVGNECALVGYQCKDQIQLIELDMHGNAIESHILKLPVVGDPVAFFKDNDTLYTWIIAGESHYFLHIENYQAGDLILLSTGISNYLDRCQWVGINNGIMYIVSDEKLVALDMEGNLLRQKSLDDKFADLSIDGKDIYLLENTGEYNDSLKFRITQMSLESFSEKRQIDFVGAAYNYVIPKLFSDETEDMVILDMESGILRCDLKTNQFELLVNLSDYGIDDAGIVDISGDGVIIAASYDIIGSRERFEGLIQCAFSKSAKEKTPINAVLFMVDGEYAPIIAAFNRSQNDYYCNIMNATSILKDATSENVTEDDFQRAFLDVLKNQDKVDMFFFPAEKLPYFLQSHVLLDMNFLKIDDDELLDTIWHASEMDGSRFFATPFFSLIQESYDGKAVSSDTLHYEQSTMQEKAQRLIHTNDHQPYIELDRCGAYIRKELLASGKISDKTLETFFGIMTKRDNKYYEMLPLREELENGSVLMLDSILSNYTNYVALYSFFGDNLMEVGPWGYDSPAICADEYIGISSGSKKLDECKILLSFFLSYDVQFSYAGREIGFPVNQAAFDDYLKYCVEQSDSETAREEYSDAVASFRSDSERDMQSEELEREIMKAISETERGESHSENNNTKKRLPNGVILPSKQIEYQALADNLRQLVLKAEEYYILDEEINDILYDEYLTFRSGKNGEKTAVGSLKSRLELYWAERGV